MSTSLSILADNLSEICKGECKACMNVKNVKNMVETSLSSTVNSSSEINKKECKACIERKNIKSECEFIGL